jgi:DNA-binding NarL/FixJ family response regulator
VGIVVTITNVTMENLHLANWIMHINSSTTKPTEFIKYQELSELEKEVLFFSALGKSTKQISSLLNNLGVRDISNATINSLISQRIYKKLDVQNLSDAISIGIESNQINSIPDSLLMSKLKPYYLIDTKKDCIIL